MRIMVIGAKSSMELAFIMVAAESKHEFIFKQRVHADLTNALDIKSLFKKHSPKVVINVSESDAKPPEMLAIMCKNKRAQLIHVEPMFAVKMIAKRLQDRIVRAMAEVQ